MGQLIKVADMNQIAPGHSFLVRLKGQEIALFNVAGTVYAISNSCTHSRGPLAEGRLTGTTVTCPWHGARFDITNGQCSEGPATVNVETYAVQIREYSIFVEIP